MSSLSSSSFIHIILSSFIQPAKRLSEADTSDAAKLAKEDEEEQLPVLIHVADWQSKGLDCPDCIKEDNETWKSWDKHIIAKAAARGHLRCLRHLHENGCPWDGGATEYAAKEGHAECLAYLLDNGCPVDSWAPPEAARNGHLECLKLLMKYKVENKKKKKNKHLFDVRAIYHAANSGHFECLKFLCDNGCNWDSTCASLAAEHGYFDCLEYLGRNKHLYKTDVLSRGVKPFDALTARYAAAGGYLDCLKYLCENDCRLNSSVAEAAAEGGHLECLKYVGDKKCRMNSSVTRAAAKGGHLECLQYLHTIRPLRRYRKFWDWYVYEAAKDCRCILFLNSIKCPRGPFGSKC